MKLYISLLFSFCFTINGFTQLQFESAITIYPISNATSLPTTTITDINGNIYVAGYLLGYMDFDPTAAVFGLTGGNTILGTPSIYLAKYDGQGNLIFAHLVQSANGLVAHSNAAMTPKICLDVDSENNIVLAASFVYGVDLDFSASNANFTSTTNPYTNLASFDIFFAKYNESGDFIFGKTLPGPGVLDEPIDLAIDESSNIYILAKFNGHIDIDPGENIMTLSSLYDTPVNYDLGLQSVFFSKYDAQGNFIFGKEIYSETFNYPNNIELDSSNNIYITGYIRGDGQIDFDPSMGEVLLSQSDNDSFQAYLVKYSSDGNLIYLKDFGSSEQISSTETVRDICVNSDDEVIIVGQLYNTEQFDGINTIDIAPGGLVHFIAKFDNVGQLQFLKSMPVAITEVENFGSAMFTITGNFSGTFDFDLGNDIHNLSGINNSCYVGLYGSNAQLVDAFSHGDSGHLYPMLATYNDQKIILGGNAQGVIDVDPSNSQVILQANNPYYNTSIVVYNFLQNECVTTYGSLTYESCGENFTYNGIVYEESGVYQQTIENYLGCDSVVTLNLNIVSFNNSITLNGNTLMAQMPNVEYQWIDCDNNDTPIDFATSQSFSPVESGNYAVELSLGECSTTSDCLYTTIISVEENSELFVNVYPNPTNGIVQFSRASGCVSFSILDVNGKSVVNERPIGIFPYTVDLSGFPKGLYFLLIKNSNNQTIQTTKISVQ